MNTPDVAALEIGRSPLKAIRWIVGCVVLAANALSGAGGAGPARADSAPAAARVTLAQALEAAWQRSRAAVGPQGQLLRAAASQRAAASLLAAPPSLAVSTRQDRWNNDAGQREHEVGVTLPLWLPGQRDARLGAARAALAVAEGSVATERLRLAGQVRELAWSIAALQAEAAAANTEHRYLRSLADDVERRVKAGDLARTDALAAQGELTGAQATLLDVEQRLQAERVRWVALTGLAEPADPNEAQRAAPTTTTDAATAPGIDAHPTLQLAALTTEAARRQADVARGDRSDAPELSVGYRRERSERGRAYDGSVVIGLRVPFGGDSRNLPLQAAAQSALDSAVADEARLRLQLDAEAAVARDAVRAAERQLDAQRSRAALLRERARLIDASFHAGETALPTLLLASSGAAQAEAALARQQAALGAARARLDQALGLLP